MNAVSGLDSYGHSTRQVMLVTADTNVASSTLGRAFKELKETCLKIEFLLAAYGPIMQVASTCHQAVRL